MKYDGVLAATGTTTSISIAKTKYKKLDSPYSDCRKDVETIKSDDSMYFKGTLKLSKYYKRLCDELCEQYEFVIPTCGCADPSVPIIDFNQTICASKTDLDCVKEVHDKYDKLNTANKCNVLCPTECDTITYSKSISIATYPTDYYV